MQEMAAYAKFCNGTLFLDKWISELADEETKTTERNLYFVSNAVRKGTQFQATKEGNTIPGTETAQQQRTKKQNILVTTEHF